ncbi:hypothetical protein FO519_006635 [Halicephalobus sp. NKZ332]|nr:hypothetical protein FO519_006635 [Halicephalobus sp. NKZ332]
MTKVSKPEYAFEETGTMVVHGPSPDTNKEKIKEISRKIFNKSCCFINCEEITTVKDLEGDDGKFKLFVSAFAEVEETYPVFGFLNLDQCKDSESRKFIVDVLERRRESFEDSSNEIIQRLMKCAFAVTCVNLEEIPKEILDKDHNSIEAEPKVEIISQEPDE